jgi:hypothetical protein
MHLGRPQRIELHRRQHRARYATNLSSLTNDAYSALIEGWNRVDKTDRALFAKECAELGHLWAETPLGCHVCRRCLHYRDTKAA